jgi:ParB family chromosome partitioning protein
MTTIDETSRRHRLAQVDPYSIEVPEVRITSTWPPELLEMLKASIQAEGIQQPILLAKEKNKLWLIDGLHRLEEAKLQGLKKVPCVVIEASLKDVLLKNLYMNRLRGGVKASEMVKVVTTLRNEHGLTSEDIARETGLKRDYIEKLLETSRATGEVLEALDREEISVGHAWEIARVPNKDVQLRLLGQVFTFRLTVKDLHNVVEETLEIIKRREELPKHPKAPEPTAVPTVRCHLCENEWPLRKVVGINVCMSCYGIAHEAVQAAKKEGRIPIEKKLASEIT